VSPCAGLRYHACVRWVSRLVTGAVILIIVVGVGLLIRAKMPTTKIAGSFQTYAKFRDASRLAVGSAVVIAGVRVGTIEKMSIEGAIARVDMRLQDGLDLPVDSFATRRADSLFGDSYVEIIPGHAGEDPAGYRRMASGEPIAHVIEGSSTDKLLRGMAGGLEQIDNALEVVHDTAIEGRQWAGGPVKDRLNSSADWLSQGHIEDPMESADRAMTTIDTLTSRGAETLASSAPEVDRTLDRVDRAIATARSRIHDTKVGLSSALKDTREGLDGIDPQLAQAAEVAAAVNDGRGNDWKGTLGRLVNDPTTGNLPTSGWAYSMNALLILLFPTT